MEASENIDLNDINRVDNIPDDGLNTTFFSRTGYVSKTVDRRVELIDIETEFMSIGTAQSKEQRTSADPSFPGSDICLKESSKSRLFCSCRLILSVASSFGMLNLYMLRFNLNVAMHWMVNQTIMIEMHRAMHSIPVNVTTPYPYHTCFEVQDPVAQEISHASEGKKSAARSEYILLQMAGGEFIWSEGVQSLVLSSFYFGQMITMILGGWLAERYGGKWFLGTAILASGICNIFIPMAARADYRILIVIRMIQGIFQGTAWPSIFVIWSRWATPKEKHRLMSLTYAGSLLGIVITFPGVAILCEESILGWGWPYVFYIPGILGIVWCFSWYYLVFDSPEKHPRISRKERAYIYNSLKGTINMSLKNHPPTPWKQLLTSRPVWALITARICNITVFYVTVSNISNYMIEVLYFGPEKAGLINVIPYIGYLIVIVSTGFLYDILLFKSKYSPTISRKIGNTLGTFIPAIFMFATSFQDCSHSYIAVALLAISISMSGFQYGTGYMNNYLDLSPQNVGVLFGISNTMAIVFVLLSPFVISELTDDPQKAVSQFRTVFILVSVMYVLGGVVFAIFGSAEIQEWDVAPVDDDKVCTDSKPSTEI